MPKSRILQTGRAGVGDDFDEVEPGLFSEALRVGEIDDAFVLAFAVDQLDLDGADVTVDSRAAFLRRRGGLHGTTNGASPVKVEPIEIKPARRINAIISAESICEVSLTIWSASPRMSTRRRRYGAIFAISDALAPQRLPISACQPSCEPPRRLAHMRGRARETQPQPALAAGAEGIARRRADSGLVDQPERQFPAVVMAEDARE